MSTKLDPGQFDCYAKLADDEPYFVLRAKDPHAPVLVRTVGRIAGSRVWKFRKAGRSSNVRPTDAEMV